MAKVVKIVKNSKHSKSDSKDSKHSSKDPKDVKASAKAAPTKSGKAEESKSAKEHHKEAAKDSHKAKDHGKSKDFSSAAETHKASAKENKPEPKPEPKHEAKHEETVVKPPVAKPMMAAPIVPELEEEIVLTDAEGRRYCKVKDCDQVSSVEDHCRYHYLALWKKIQVRRKILTDGKLERYVEELTSRYPDKFLEMIKKDLRTEKDFLVVIAELEIDEANVDGDFEDEAGSFADDVRGMGSDGGSSLSEEEEF